MPEWSGQRRHLQRHLLTVLPARRYVVVAKSPSLILPGSLLCDLFVYFFFPPLVLKIDNFVFLVFHTLGNVQKMWVKQFLDGLEWLWVLFFLVIFQSFQFQVFQSLTWNIKGTVLYVVSATRGCSIKAITKYIFLNLNKDEKYVQPDLWPYRYPYQYLGDAVFYRSSNKTKGVTLSFFIGRH